MLSYDKASLSESVCFLKHIFFRWNWNNAYQYFYSFLDCISWNVIQNLNTVHSLIPSPGAENRPNTFYFGYLGDDVDACAAACASEPACTVTGNLLTMQIYSSFFLRFKQHVCKKYIFDLICSHSHSIKPRLTTVFEDSATEEVILTIVELTNKI